MNLTRESEALLANVTADWDIDQYGEYDRARRELVADLAAIEDAVRAEQAAEVEAWKEDARRYAANADYWRAEVARLREALAEAMGWLERSDREQNVHQFRHGMSMLRAALAVDPAVAPAPDPAPPAPGERCEDCAGNFVDGYCRRHEPSFHGYNGAVSVPEPAR